MKDPFCTCGACVPCEIRRTHPEAVPPVGQRSRPRPASPPVPAAATVQIGLGDAVKAALTAVGVTEERVSSWIGGPCGCSERVKKLNELGEWAAGTAAAGADAARGFLERMMGR